MRGAADSLLALLRLSTVQAQVLDTLKVMSISTAPSALK